MNNPIKSFKLYREYLNAQREAEVFLKLAGETNTEDKRHLYYRMARRIYIVFSRTNPSYQKQIESILEQMSEEQFSKSKDKL